MATTEMKRILPAQVQEAYQVSELTPIYNGWLEGESCGCAVSALVCAKGPEKKAEWIDFIEQGAHWAETFEKVEVELELDKSYTGGFVNGFDRLRRLHDSNYNLPRYKQGYLDGYEASKLMFPDWDRVPSEALATLDGIKS